LGTALNLFRFLVSTKFAGLKRDVTSFKALKEADEAGVSRELVYIVVLAQILYRHHQQTHPHLLTFKNKALSKQSPGSSKATCCLYLRETKKYI
jgi:hypothetical protein